MATAEQVQEALNRIQNLEAATQELQTKLAAAEARAQAAEQRAQQADGERTILIRAIGNMKTNNDNGGPFVHPEGIGQPKAFAGKRDGGDFTEFTHKTKI